jgi:hypothetical protein
MTPCSPLSFNRRFGGPYETQRTTWHHIPEDDTLQNHRCENLKSYIFNEVCNFKWAMLKTYLDRSSILLFCLSINVTVFPELLKLSKLGIFGEACFFNNSLFKFEQALLKFIRI